ncbi:PTS glucose transporter subunit IIB [Metamycoplasma spumans]|uniref:PTS glucose transporter subunit IIB n=1 Tax=Metamycoplasma spumans TaxID=92406 RepID=UPI0034DD2F8F
MNSKHKALYIFLLIITFGLIKIYWNKKYRKNEVQTSLSREEKLSFDYDKFIYLLGGKSNIEDVASTQKIIKITFKERTLINSEGLKMLDGVSGLAFQSKSISLVIGNSARFLENKIKEDIENE